MEHLIKTVIPLARKLKVPDEPPTSFPCLPQLQKLGTVSNLAKKAEEQSDKDLEQMKVNVREELKRREDAGERDRLEECQCNVPPEWKKLNKFEMEMLFEYPGEDGSQCLGWYHGRVDKLISERNHSVLIK